MRILLVLPVVGYPHTYPTFVSSGDFPVGFAYLASALRAAGHDVHGLNPNNDASYGSAQEMLQDKLRRVLAEVMPELVCIGGLCTDFAFLRDAVRIIRRSSPGIPIVCGGGIVNNDALFTLTTLHSDFCIVGEGEEALVQLADAIRSGRRDYEAISNLGYWRNGQPHLTNQSFEYGTLDSRHFPDYEPFGIDDILDNYGLTSRYLYRYTRPVPRLMTVVTARSCPFRCTFCVHQRGPRYRARSITNVMEEICLLYEKYHFNVLIILDELFAVNKERLNNFCEEVLSVKREHKWDFDWLFQTHASAALRRGDLEIAKKAGCYFFSYGIESASPRILASMNKKTKPSQISEAISIANSVKIGFGGNFIFGDVAETKETILETIDFFRKHCYEDHVYLGSIRPYPGSKLFEDCVSRGIVRDKLSFYKHIDALPINMTGIPDTVWFHWVNELEQVAASFPWVKSSFAFSYEEDTEMQNNKFCRNSGVKIYRVSVKCPHCGETCFLLEPLRLEQNRAVKGNAIVEFLSKIKSAYFRERSRLPSYCLELPGNLIFRLRMAVKKRMEAFSNELKTLKKEAIFKELDALKKISTATPVSFITGCMHCNKRFRVNITSSPEGNDGSGNFL